jgi:hypothetical protein
MSMEWRAEPKKQSEDEREPDVYEPGTVVSFPRGSPEDEAWTARWRALAERFDAPLPLDSPVNRLGSPPVSVSRVSLAGLKRGYRREGG